MVKIFAIQTIYHNLGKIFDATREIDPETGDYRVRAIPTVLTAGEFHDVPDALASEMIESGAARLMTKQECQLQALAQGTAVPLNGHQPVPNPAAVPLNERQPLANPADMYGNG